MADDDRGTLLFVEDDDDLRATTSAALAGSGYRVVEAGTSSAALEILRAGLRPDAVVLDWILPDGSGSDVLGWMRGEASLKNVPVVVVTGSSLNAHSLPVPVLAKPLVLATLRRALQDALAQPHDHDSADEPPPYVYEMDALPALPWTSLELESGTRRADASTFADVVKLVIDGERAARLLGWDGSRPSALLIARMGEAGLLAAWRHSQDRRWFLVTKAPFSAPAWETAPASPQAGHRKMALLADLNQLGLDARGLAADPAASDDVRALASALDRQLLSARAVLPGFVAQDRFAQASLIAVIDVVNSLGRELETSARGHAVSVSAEQIARRAANASLFVRLHLIAPPTRPARG